MIFLNKDKNSLTTSKHNLRTNSNKNNWKSKKELTPLWTRLMKSRPSLTQSMDFLLIKSLEKLSEPSNSKLTMSLSRMPLLSNQFQELTLPSLLMEMVEELFLPLS
jgi:hypothetical protein